LKKFLIINPYGIGDVLFTTPLLRAIKEADPENTVSFWSNERVRGILEDNPILDNVFALSRGDLKKIYQQSYLEAIHKSVVLLRQIKKERFDVTLDFSLDYRYSLICKVLGIKRRIGFDFRNRGRFLTDRVCIDGYSDKHMVEYYSNLLSFIDIPLKATALNLFVSQDSSIRAQGILSRARLSDTDLLVGIAPGAGASWGKDAHLKHWPALKFAQLADRIIGDLGARIILLGDDSEKTISEVIVAAMKNKPLDLTGKTNLRELAAIISHLKLLVTNDGGLLHMAVALGVETVSVFGPVDERVYGPYPKGPRHIVVKKDVSCRPCYREFRMPLCEHDRECIKNITLDEVYNAVRSLL